MVFGIATVWAAPARHLTVSSLTMSDSPGRELQADVTYANIGLVFGSKLMNESPVAVHGRESRAAASRAHARAFDCSGMDFA